LSPGPLHWGAPAWSDGPGVKLLVPRSRTDLPGVKSLAARRQDRETGTDCLGPKLQASSIKQQATNNYYYWSTIISVKLYTLRQPQPPSKDIGF